MTTQAWGFVRQDKRRFRWGAWVGEMTFYENSGELRWAQWTLYKDGEIEATGSASTDLLAMDACEDAMYEAQLNALP